MSDMIFTLPESLIWFHKPKEKNKRLKKLVDSYANDLVARSTEQSKTTIELQKQYEKLLVEVKELVSRPIP
jgi:hypothetical protein